MSPEERFPAGKFAANGEAHGFERRFRRLAPEAREVAEGLAREGEEGGVVRVARVADEELAAPAAVEAVRGAGEGLAPFAREAEGIFLVAQFAAG